MKDAAQPLDLFADTLSHLPLNEGAVLLGGFALPFERPLLDILGQILESAPLRSMITPGGRPMSVATTSCGSVGWVSDHQGYRYTPIDPDSGHPWPGMPPLFQELATQAAQRAGFPDFQPDACLINHYAPGARMSLHQDRDEHNLGHPIVSVSLGLPGVFLWGGQRRCDRVCRVPLVHGDVVVWGGPARLTFHGVLPVVEGIHPLTGRARYNLTFRRAR